LSENEEKLAEDLAEKSKHEVSDSDGEEEASEEVKPKKPQTTDHESPVAGKILDFIKQSMLLVVNLIRGLILSGSFITM